MSFRWNKTDLISGKLKKTHRYLNYVGNLLILFSAIAGCVSNCAFTSLVWVLLEITTTAIGIKMCAITAGIKKYNSVIKKEEAR